MAKNYTTFGTLQPRLCQIQIHVKLCISKYEVRDAQCETFTTQNPALMHESQQYQVKFGHKQ